MVIAASQVRLLCAGPEIALVRASRTPQLEQLSKVQLKRHAVRARKLLDKWRGLGRGQSRDQRKTTGSSELAKNTRIKRQIFRDALEAFEAQLARPATSTPKAAKPIPPTSQQRTTEHRATRAAMRTDLAAVEETLNAKAQKKKPARAKSTTAPSAAAPPPKERGTSSAKPARKPAASPAAAPVESGSASKPPLKLAAKGKRRETEGVESDVTKKPPLKGAAASTAKQRAAKQRPAIAAAKQSRIARSGKTTRMFGHVSARGKRAQARRDTKR